MILKILDIRQRKTLIPERGGEKKKMNPTFVPIAKRICRLQTGRGTQVEPSSLPKLGRWNEECGEARA